MRGLFNVVGVYDHDTSQRSRRPYELRHDSGRLVELVLIFLHRYKLQKLKKEALLETRVYIGVAYTPEGTPLLEIDGLVFKYETSLSKHFVDIVDKLHDVIERILEKIFDFNLVADSLKSFKVLVSFNRLRVNFIDVELSILVHV